MTLYLIQWVRPPGDRRLAAQVVAETQDDALRLLELDRHDIIVDVQMAGAVDGPARVAVKIS